MVAIAALLLLASGLFVFFWTVRRGVYRRYPYELFVLAGASALVGLFAALESPGPVSVALAAVEGIALALLVAYVVKGARFSRGDVAVKVGDRFPAFRLPDSEGGAFESASMVGKSAALYLFYRGDW
jgi:hypothetical protein